MNHVSLIGRMTQDPELSILQDDSRVVRFTLAVKRRGTKTEATDFVDCVAWNNVATLICRHLTKGQQVGVHGPLRTHIYETSQGFKRKVTEVDVRDITFVGSSADRAETERPDSFERSASADTEIPTQSASAQGFTAVTEDDDLPF